MQQQREIHLKCRQAGCKVMNWHQTPKQIEQLEVATIPKSGLFLHPIPKSLILLFRPTRNGKLDLCCLLWQKIAKQ